MESLKTVKADFEIHFSNVIKNDTLQLFINKNARIERRILKLYKIIDGKKYKIAVYKYE